MVGNITKHRNLTKREDCIRDTGKDRNFSIGEAERQGWRGEVMISGGLEGACRVGVQEEAGSAGFWGGGKNFAVEPGCEKGLVGVGFYEEGVWLRGTPGPAGEGGWVDEGAAVVVDG